MTASLFQDFAARGLIADSSEGLTEHLATGSRTLYVGFDPTADSLHIGSLLPLLALRRAQLARHRPVVLVGGGTGLIGDPSGKAGERALNPTEVVREWAERLKGQVARFVDFERGPLSAVLVDNYEWISALDVVSFLRDVGKHFAVGAMLARESVKARLQAGISFTEFSYQVLQAYDFLCLLRRHDCTVQMGGSDQWGNITAGIELIRRMDARPAFGLTLPLVTKGDGGKFGKTETGTIWLDPARTSAYEMYQFWLNTADGDVLRFLKYFTFLPLQEVDEVGRLLVEHPERREAQGVLAREVTRLVHGVEGLAEAEQVTADHFGDGSALEGKVIETAEPRRLWSVLREIGMVPSASEARRLISQGGVAVNRQRVTDSDFQLFPGQGYLVQIGKRRVQRVVLTAPA